MSTEMVFSKIRIGDKKAPCRLVSQPMEANDAGDGGGVSERTLERYSKLGRGRWGIVIVEALSVTADSLARPRGLVINRNNLDGFKRLADAFRSEDPDGLLLFQLTHSGPQSGAFSRKAGVLADPPEGCVSLSPGELETIRDQFAASAGLAEEAGADGIDLKMCHGYLGAEILRPSNTRPDEWGGSFENRTRLLRESVEKIKAGRKNSSFLMGSRISVYEGIRGGCGTHGPDELIEDLTEIRKLVRLMDSLGMDYVNVSAGIPALTPGMVRPAGSSKNFYLQHFRYTRQVKEMKTGLKVIGSAYSVLKERSLSLAEENIQKGYTDFAGFGRQSFADPLFPRKLREGRKPDYCTACSGCSRLLSSLKQAGCVKYDEYYRKLLREKS